MTRISIIGNVGGGKSRLSQQLGQKLNLPVYEVDKVQWQPGWIRAPEEDVARWQQGILSQDRWLVDGWGSWPLLANRFAAADTIIFVDFPLVIHYWWATKRQVKSLFRPREGGPEGCPLWPKTMELYRLMWHVHFELRPSLIKLMAQYQNNATLIHLRSPQQMRRFLQNAPTVPGDLIDDAV